MIVELPCGHRVDDEHYDTVCPHYPLGAGAGTYCKTHDLFRPCPVCEVPPMARATEYSPADAERYGRVA